MAQEAANAKELQKQFQQELTAKETAANKDRTGKGLRVRFGQTRGRNPKVVDWEAFDTDQPETLPVSIQEFMSLTKTPETQQGQSLLVSYLVDGFNSSQYAAASDVLSEYTEPNWPDSLVKSFKQAVNGYIAASGVSVEDAVSLMKPAIQKGFDARMAAASATK